MDGCVRRPHGPHALPTPKDPHPRQSSPPHHSTDRNALTPHIGWLWMLPVCCVFGSKAEWSINPMRQISNHKIAPPLHSYRPTPLPSSGPGTPTSSLGHSAGSLIPLSRTRPRPPCPPSVCAKPTTRVLSSPLDPASQPGEPIVAFRNPTRISIQGPPNTD